ncbi:Protein kinase domain-containing protein [Rubrivivax sp. A210]|uniref:serine/threonine-protein kinase n=1 Tax=Rubrivivax sp. A210 TaxID=2772301 RepID=UPI00191802F0|nr:serine/threonine-protein kinase [Rubrivivax sp. A210]CAD5369282.1 Protein kinase domain-containing protein [Rubrivivax sp. A210]
MTSDAHDDDRTVIRPSGPAPAAGFQSTEWSAEAAGDRTVIAPPPPPVVEDDSGGHLARGTMLAEFRLDGLIGEGGFGVVYKAFDTSLEREVALKEYMPSSLAQRVGKTSQVQVKSERYRETFLAGRESFVKEAKMLASFDHPSLVKVYRFWEANGTAYMVMPLLKGTTLKDVLSEKKAGGQAPDEAWLRSVLGPLTEALLVIHAEQVYHRDIAPDNVMYLPEKDRWLLLDFGAARRVISEQTQALTVILKPGYAPVEQYAEIPGMKQGPWTDVYALAAVVYFAIVGRTPPPSVGRLLNDNYKPLLQAAAGRFSDAFLSAVDRALAVRPEQRTQSIGEFRSDLGLGVAPDPYATRPIPPGTEMPARRPEAHHVQQATVALPTPFAKTPPAAQPQQAPASRPAATPGVQPAAAAPKGKGALIGAAVAGVLAVAGGAYFALTPSSQPAPAVVAAAPPVAAPAPAPAASVVAPAPAPMPAPAPTPVQAPFDVGREFERIVARQSPTFGVRAETKKVDLQIGKDDHKFSVTADREGYLYVVASASDGSLAQIVPNSMGGSVKLKKGQTWRFPTGDGFALAADAPAGSTTMLVMVSAWQRSHDALNPKTESHIRIFPAVAEIGALAARWDGPNSILAGKPLCAAGGPCDDEYGAALLHYNVK